MNASHTLPTPIPPLNDLLTEAEQPTLLQDDLSSCNLREDGRKRGSRKSEGGREERGKIKGEGRRD